MIRLPAIALFGVLFALSQPTSAQDASDFVVRLNRVEGQMRQLSGQVEQLQFENKQLKDQLRKFQEDVEFRFQERGGRSGAPSAGQPATTRPAKRSDAFDPAADPAAPGAPRTLGQPSAGATAPREARAPDVRPGPDTRGGIASIIDEDEDRPAGTRPLDLGAAGRVAGSQTQSAAGPRIVEVPAAGPATSDSPRADYDIAYAYLMQRQYDRAEASFRGFVQAHPRDRLVPDAIFWLGETYLQRNRPREAAEQFLKVSTEHARSTKAPDALLKLGVSLAALGARDQACATFAELERKFPTAAPNIRQGVDREQKRARCPA